MKDKKIFISSTFTDLKEHRESVQNAIRKAGGIDVSMEHFGSRDNRPLDECIRIIQEEADIFVGIYAFKYGYVPNEQDKSITELEYWAAHNSNKPILIFVIDEETPWPKKYIDFGILGEKLNSFKQELGERRIWSEFSNKDNLASLVVASIIRELDFRGIKSTENATLVDIDSVEEWRKYRDDEYKEKRGVFLTHVLRPSNKKGWYDIFIYLIKHKNDSESIDEVKQVEFYFGKSWGNKVFTIKNEGNYIGIMASAYGEFLCTARVTFNEGKPIMMTRYIDFENDINKI